MWDHTGLLVVVDDEIKTRALPSINSKNYNNNNYYPVKSHIVGKIWSELMEAFASRISLSEPGFDPGTCGLWPTTLPLRHSDFVN